MNLLAQKGIKIVFLSTRQFLNNNFHNSQQINIQFEYLHFKDLNRLRRIPYRSSNFRCLGPFGAKNSNKGNTVFIANSLIVNRIKSNTRCLFTEPTGGGGPTSNLFKSLMGPPEENPHEIGQRVVAGCSAVGLVALCYYGLHISKKPSTRDRYSLWQDFVRNRVRATYAYFGASLFWTAGSACFAFRSATLMKMLMANSWIVLGASLSTQILSGIVVLNSSYREGHLFTFKHLAWMVHCAIMGVTIAPMCYIGGPLLVKAFILTGGVIGALSAIAYCAPEERFITWSAPLAIALGCILASTIGSYIFPQTTKLGMGLMSLYLYGGLVVFSLMLLYDTQEVIKQAEMEDPHGFDPINAAMSLYMDALNIFVRFVQLFALQEFNRRKK